MAILSSDEVFQMAMQMEDSGQAFYEAVAAECTDLPVAELCRHLAAEERTHLSQFEALRQAQARRPASRPMSWDEMGFAQAMIEEKVLPDRQDARRMARDGTLPEVLDRAIRMEQDSVAFYTDLLSAVDAEDAEPIRGIIDQEKRHAGQLAEARGALKA